MGRLTNAIVSVLVLGLAMTGCGGSNTKSQSSTAPASESQTSSTPQTGENATTPAATATQTPAGEPRKHLARISIPISSPALNEGSQGTTIPARYTCDGADAPPPLRWSAVPRGTVELVLFVIDFNGHEPGGGPVAWAVAGLRPTLRGIGSGTLPAGTIVGRNSHGQSRYSLCPPKGSARHYVVALYALRRPVSVRPGFDARALSQTLSKTAEDKGLTGFFYKRA